mgnify:CR=1 FL=1
MTERRKYSHDEALHRLIDDKDKNEITNSNKLLIQSLYIIFAVIWVIIVYFFSLYMNNIAIWIILFIPLIVFGLNYYWVFEQTIELPSLVFNADFLSIGFLIVTIIINWYREVSKKDIFILVVITVIFLALGLIDFWTSEENFIVIQNFRSAIETIAITLLLIIVLKYYERVKEELFF